MYWDLLLADASFLARALHKAQEYVNGGRDFQEFLERSVHSIYADLAHLGEDAGYDLNNCSKEFRGALSRLTRRYQGNFIDSVFNDLCDESWEGPVAGDFIPVVIENNDYEFACISDSDDYVPIDDDEVPIYNTGRHSPPAA